MVSVRFGVVTVLGLALAAAASSAGAVEKVTVYSLFVIPPAGGKEACGTAMEALRGDAALRIVSGFPEPGQVLDGPTAWHKWTSLEAANRVTAAALDYSERGLSPEQKRDVLAADGYWGLFVVSPLEDVGATLLAANRAVHRVAEQCGGVVLDDATQEYFAAATWKAQRQSGWHGARPYVRNQITIILYDAAPDRSRLVTHGLVKLGLPDLAIDRPVKNDRDNLRLQALVDLLAQRLDEGLQPDAGKPLRVAVTEVRNPTARKAFQALVHGDGGVVELRWRLAPSRDLADPPGPVEELLFDDHVGATPAERQQSALKRLWGGDGP